MYLQEGSVLYLQEESILYIEGICIVSTIECHYDMVIVFTIVIAGVYNEKQ